MVIISFSSGGPWLGTPSGHSTVTSTDTLCYHRRHPAAPPTVSLRAGTRRAACPFRAALMAPPPPAYVPVLKRRSENRVLEDVKKEALKHCDGLVKEFVDCTKVRVSRLAVCGVSVAVGLLFSFLPSSRCAFVWQRASFLSFCWMIFSTVPDAVLLLSSFLPVLCCSSSDYRFGDMLLLCALYHVDLGAPFVVLPPAA